MKTNNERNIMPDPDFEDLYIEIENLHKEIDALHKKLGVLPEKIVSKTQSFEFELVEGESPCDLCIFKIAWDCPRECGVNGYWRLK